MDLRVRKIDLLIYIMLLLPDQFCYLLDASVFKSIFGINYRDFTFICYVLIFVYVMLKYGIRPMSKEYHFKWHFLWIIPMSIIAAAIPHQLFGQSTLAGFMVQRGFFILPLIYYTFRTLMKKGIITWEKLFHMMCCIGVVSLILCLIQYFTYNWGLIFLDATFRYRSGLRIRSNFGYPIIVILMSINVFIKNKSRAEKIKAIVCLAISLFFEVFIMQTRLEIIGIAAAAIVMIAMNREGMSKKLFWFLCILLAGVAFMNTNLGQMLVTGINSVSDGTDLRTLGRTYYLEKLTASPIWGFGYPHESCKAAETAAGYYVYDSWGFGLSDNGIFGLAYIYGIAGVVWFFIIHLKLVILSIKAMRKRLYIFLPYVTYLLVIMVNMVQWYWHVTPSFVWVAVAAVLETIMYDKYMGA